MHNLLFVEGMSNGFTFCFPNLIPGTEQERITHEVRKKLLRATHLVKVPVFCDKEVHHNLWVVYNQHWGCKHI